MYNPFVVVKPKPKSKSLPKTKIKPKPKTKLEAKGLSLDYRKKLDIFYAKGFVKTSRKKFYYDIGCKFDYNYDIIDLRSSAKQFH